MIRSAFHLVCAGIGWSTTRLNRIRINESIFWLVINAEVFVPWLSLIVTLCEQTPHYNCLSRILRIHYIVVNEQPHDGKQLTDSTNQFTYLDTLGLGLNYMNCITLCVRVCAVYIKICTYAPKDTLKFACMS